MTDWPMADAGNDKRERRRTHAAIARRNLAGASNNTRWNELIAYFRAREGWRPSYRSKSVTGVVTTWDVEWFCHLPFPFHGVEWFDIGLHEDGPFLGHLLPKTYIDHAGEILALLGKIGFDFEQRSDVVRIWGYLPRSYEDFPPQ